MEFDINSNSVPYSPSLHSHCLSNLKEYGDYYQITVSKMINDVERTPLTDRQKEWVRQGLTRSEALFFDWCFEKNLLNLFGSDFMNYKPDIDHVGRYINNIMRAKKTLDEIGNCNEWDYFVTLTISPEKFDRFDLKSFYKLFSYFKSNYRRDTGCKFGYVFVPEQHEDGAWHLHGLIKDLPVEHLTEYFLKDFYPYTSVKIPMYIKEKLAHKERLFYWKPYTDRFGWCIFESLRDKGKASNYITKYIGKGFIGNEQFKNTRLLIPSLGLKRAEKIKKGFTSINDIKPSFDCDYATTFKFPKSKYSLDDVLKYFL
jgi:hypothetical protein